MVSRFGLHSINGHHIGKFLVGSVGAKICGKNPFNTSISCRVDDLQLDLAHCFKIEHQDYGFIVFEGSDKRVM